MNLSDNNYNIEQIIPILEKFEVKWTNREELEKIIQLIKPEAKEIRDFAKLVDCFFTDDFSFSSRTVENYLDDPVVINQFLALFQILDELPNWEPLAIELQIEVIANKLHLEKQYLFTLLRIAVTGFESGPDLYRILEIIGRQRTLQRLQQRANEIKRKYGVLSLLLGKPI